MKLIFEQELYKLENGVFEFRLRFTGDEICEIRERVDERLLTDETLKKRMIDKIFYELKEQVYKNLK
jgi:hypothetical protein